MSEEISMLYFDFLKSNARKASCEYVKNAGIVVKYRCHNNESLLPWSTFLKYNNTVVIKDAEFHAVYICAPSK